MKMVCSNCNNETFTISLEDCTITLHCNNCQAGTILKPYVDDDTMKNKIAYFPADDRGIIKEKK